MTLLWAILLVGLLVTVHELGHFAAAKLLRVKVERLSFGFGPRLFAIRRGETEYAVSAVPLGGYVKMLGEDPNDPVGQAEAGRAFGHRPLWQRLAIVLAGPAANLVFPAVVYFHFYLGQDVSLSSTVGVVLDDQPASGVLQPGDRIVAIDDEAVRYWEDVKRLVGAAPGRDLRITIERPGEGDKPLVKVLTPRAHEERDLLGARQRVGLFGVEPYYRLAQIGVVRPSAAWDAGLRTFDIVTSVQGRPVSSWRDVDAALQQHRGETLIVTYLRARSEGQARKGGPLQGPTAGPGFASVERLEPGTAQVVPDRVNGVPSREGPWTVVLSRPRYETGIRSGELFVRDVEEGSPAAIAGIHPGDELTTLDGQPLRHHELLERAFEEQPERTFRIGWRAASGEAREEALKLSPRTRRDEYQTESTLYLFGAEPARARKMVPSVPIEARGPWAARQALATTWAVTATTAKILLLLLSGRLPASAIGGPIMIYHLAGVAAAHGADQFLAMAALVSLNLGLLNLLPVPVLDGGHMAFIAVEALRRRPISARTRERATWLGVALLAALMLLAARNDIVRYWFT